MNAVLGVCLDPGNQCVLMQHASHGSLRDVISSGELSWDFRTAFITDIVEGMKYLHSTQLGIYSTYCEQIQTFCRLPFLIN